MLFKTYCDTYLMIKYIPVKELISKAPRPFCINNNNSSNNQQSIYL